MRRSIPRRYRRAALLAWSVAGAMSALCLAPAQQTPGAAPSNPAVRMLVVKTEAEAREAVAQCTAGLAFDRIVRERSIGPAHERGGYLARTDVDSLSQMARSAVLSTRPGRLTPVFPVEGGFAVFQVLTELEEIAEEERLRREPEALDALTRGIEVGRGGDLEGAVRFTPKGRGVESDAFRWPL